MAFDPIPTSFDLDDPKNPQGDFGPGARKISNELGKAQQADPLKEGIAVRTQRKADLSRTKQALDQLEGTFLSTDGAGLFALNEKGKPFKNPDGTYVPDLGAKVENLRARATGQVGAIRGALFPGVSRGDPTGDALAAQAELSNIEPVYEAKRQKWERIQEQRNRWKEAHDQNELELGALSAQRLARDGLLYAPQQPAPMGQPAPAPTPMQPSEPSVVPAAAAPAQDPTFLSEVGKNATDLVASFGSGSNALLKMAGDLYGLASGDFNNWLSEQGKYGMDYFERMKSPEMLAKQQARKAAIDAAPDELGKALEFVRSTISDPMLLASSVTEQLPNTVGAGGVGAVVRKGAEKLLLRKAATEAAKQIAERQALKAGVGAAVGAGAVMQGADVGGDQYGEVLVQMERMTKPQLEKIPEIAELLKRGASIDEAKTAYALTQARKTGLVAGAVSVGAQMLPGARVIEKTLAGGSAARSTMGRLAAGAAGLVAEGASEAIEEGGGRVAQNVFAQGVDPERKLTAGVGETVGQAVVTGGIMGGAAGVVNGGEQEETTNNQPPPPAQPPVAPAPAQPGPAAPQAPQAQAPAPAPVEDEGPVTVDPELQAELDAETQQPATPAPVSTQGGPDAQAGLIRQSSVGSTPTPAPTSQPPVSPWKVSSPEVKSAWMEGPPADDTKMQQIRDSFTQPGVKLGYSVFDGAPGRPRALQIDAIDANGESMVSSNIYDLARAGIEVPIPPASLKPGTYSREQIEQALGSQAPTTTETSADVTQSPQSGIAGNETETTEAKPKYEKSSTQVTLPEEQAKPFRDFGASIPDEDIYEDPENPRFGRETEPHITALYGIENDDVDAVKSALAGVGPIKAMLGEVTSFENADKPYDVLKVDVNSPALRKVNEAIKQGTKNSSDFPDYKPHLTIGYVKKGMAKKYVGDDRFAGNTFTFNSLQFRTRDGRSIDIPLTGSTTSAQTTTQAPGSGEGITNGQMPQGSATPTGAGTLPSNGQSQKVPTEAEGQVGGQQPAPGVRPGAGKGPAIARGSNTPARFAQVATQAAGLKSSDTGSKFLRDFAPRLQKANAKAFADMEVNVLTDAEWKAHPSLSKSNPDSPAAFNVDRNILHLNADKLKGGQKIAEAIVHEAGHFAEFFALGEEFTQQQWESLTDEQRQDAAKSYDWKDERSGAELKADRRARAEWVAMQFTRVVTGDTAAMEPTLKQKLEDWLQVVREVVQQWLGNKRYTTAELDAKILELIGYKAPPSAEGNQSPQPGESAPADAAKDGQATQQGSGTTNVPKPAPAPKPAPPKSKVDELADKLFDGLLGAPVSAKIEQVGFPRDRRQMANDLAESMFDSGIRTPEAMAAYLDQKFNKQARKFSQSLWSTFAFVDPSLASVPNWDEVYAKIDTPAAPAPKPAPKGTLAERSQNASAAINARLSELDTPLTWQELFEITDRAFGGTQADGTYTVKDAYDALEGGVNQYILQKLPMPREKSVVAAEDYIQMLQTEILDRIPTQTKRTEEQDRMQQFSTPPHFAFVANWVASLSENDIYLEPSAGVGGLAVFAKSAGVGGVIANELSPRRRAVLEQSDIAEVVLGENAEVLNSILTPKIRTGEMLRPTVVVMNPPFSNAAVSGARGDTTIGAQHIDEAMKLLPPGGRLVAIVGEGMAMGKPTFAGWWRTMQGKYHVRANVHVDGKNYTKYGTSFSNQLLVIDKPRENDVVGLTQPLVAEIDSISQLPSLLEQVRNERIPIQPPKAEPTPPKSGGGGSTSQTKPGVGSGSGSNSSPRTGNVSNGGDGRPSAGSGAARPKSPSAGASRPQAGGVPDAGRPDGGNAAGNSGADSGRAPAEQSTGVVLGDTGNTPVTNIEDGAVFADYAPAKVRVAGAMPHPTPLVESAAMASVPPPDPTYVPNLPAEAVSKSLSDAQLENVIYAGQAHEKLLPDGSRRGYFIGDGTGVGKGRQIAAVILDNWRRGRKRAVWVSKSSNLIEDAKRDMTDVGLDPSLIHSLNKVAKSGKAGISVGDGIVFSTYTTLAKGHNGLDADGNLRVSERKSRLDQLMSWLGKDFDGVIAFDEAHQAGNAVAIRGERGVKKPSNTGIAVVDLQKVFPKARILYVSATGATEVSNLSYAERLGIWGPGTPFRDKLKFIQEISAGGVSAMEIVARDLKSLGSYLARTLSFKGIKFDRVEQALSGDQRDNYNEISRAWQIVFQNMDAAMDISGASNSSEARKNARGAFFGAQQRFFNQLLTAMEMPAVIRDAELQLANGNSVVFQLVNTNESTQDRELARLNEEENPDLEDMDLSPKDILLQYVNNSFPTAKYVEEADPNNPDDTRWVPLKDSEGNIVQDPEAVARKEELLSRISSLQMPANPIELILGKFGVENVAEITGRSSRVVQKADENGVVRRVLERNRTKDVLGVEAKQFQDGERRALIFSGAGGTGFSYHASRKAKNQQLRVHYLVQAGWRADAALQGFGRTHRSDQAQPPLYKLAMTNLQGHRRFVSTIARRLEQLGALTSGDRQTAGQGMFSDKDNLESEYAEMALLTLFRNLYENTVEGFSFDELSRKMGFGQTIEGEWVNALVDPQTGGLNVSKIPTVQQFLNRILALEFDDQNALFDQFMSRMEQAIDVAKERGEFDPGTQTYKALSIEKKSDEVVYQDPNSTAQTRIVEIEAQDPVEFTQFDEIAQLGSSPVERYVRNTTSKRVYALKEGPVRTDEVSGRLVPMFRRIGTHGGIEVLPRADFSTEKYETIPEANARSAWDSEIERADKIKRKKEHFIVGSFLPIWDRIKIASPRIFRFRTTEGEQLLGAVIPPRLLPGVRQRLGAKSGAITPAQAVTNIIEDGQSYNLANEWKVKRVKISGSYRIEVTGPTHLDQNEFRNYIGGFTERIQFDTRFFIPTDREQAVEAMTKLLKKSPIIQDETLLGAPSESSEPAPEKEPLPSSLINKPAPVPDRPGWFFRSEPDSLRALGYSVSQQVHERRSQATANEQALEILSLMDEDKATMLALDPNENGIPGDVKTILYGELMDRQAKIMGNANSTPLQRAKAQRRMQQMNNVKAPIFTERGQEMSALQQVYKNAAGGGIAQYLHHKKKEQEEALGGEKGMADIKAAADELTKVNEQSIEEATRAMNKALRAIPLTKPIWKKYKDWAAQRVFDWLDGITKPPQEMAGLERFTREIVDQVKSRMKEEMGDAAKAQKLPERNPSDILRDAILNKEKYREVFDNVLKKLEAEYGEDHPLVEQAHIALGAMGAKPWSKGTLDKVIKQAHEAMGQNVRELAKLHYTNANRLHRDLADALSDIAGIGATTAKELADDLAKRMQELTAEAKKKAILGIVRRNTATPKTREKMTAIERAVLLNNYGALSVPELADVVAKELKLPHISPEQMKEIARIGDRIETATNMADKAKAELDMLRALRIARGISQMDVNTSIWYANMLSGYTTQVANVIGNMMTGTMQLATIMATNPKYAGEALRGWINGFGEGWAQGAAILKTGRGSREFDANKAGEAGNVLELVDFKRDFPDMNAKWANARQKHTKALRYVTRMMKAVDSVFYYPAREAFARVAVAKLLEGEFKGKELIDKVRETLAISTEQFQAAQKRAKAEGFEGIDLVLRVSNIIEEARRATKVGAEAADASEKFALESTFNNEPVGWAGILYQHLVPLTQSIAPGGVPVLRVFLPFLRVPTNLFNASMNYTPVGAVRALRGMPTEAVRGDDGKFSVKRQDFTADERKRLYAQSIGGSLAMAGLAVLAMSGGDDDEERWFDITSTGPDDYKKRQQLEATGWRPHSIKMGDTWVSYKDSPLLVALAVTGHVVDAIRYGKQDDEVALGSKVANAFLTAPRAIMETSMLSGLGQLMEYASGRASAKQLAAFLTRTATGVAVPNLLQQIDRQFSSEVRESNGPLGTAGASLPFVRRAGDVKTDVLGEAVERNPLSRFGGIESNDPLREVLRDKGVFISTPSRDTKLGNAPMDEETYREYIRISGERIRQRLTQSVRALQAQSKENVERIVDRVIREERERAKNSLRGRAGAN